MTDQTQRLEIATVRAEIGSNITYRFNNDAIDAGGIPTESGDIKNLKLIIKEIEDKASVSTSIYPTVADGLAATEEGGMFLVASAEDNEIYEVWRKVGGVAVDTGKRTLSSQAVEDAVNSSQNSAESAAASALAAANSASDAVDLRNDLESTEQNKGSAVLGRSVVVVDSMAAFQQVVGKESQVYFLRAYHAALGVGGGTFNWDPGQPKSSHNGGVIISPTVPWDGLMASHAAYLAATGETDPSGTGCFVRVDRSCEIDNFGAVSDGSYSAVAPIRKAWAWLVQQAVTETAFIAGDGGRYLINETVVLSGAFPFSNGVHFKGKAQFFCSHAGAGFRVDGSAGRGANLILGHIFEDWYFQKTGTARAAGSRGIEFVDGGDPTANRIFLRNCKFDFFANGLFTDGYINYYLDGTDFYENDIGIDFAKGSTIGTSNVVDMHNCRFFRNNKHIRSAMGRGFQFTSCQFEFALVNQSTDFGLHFTDTYRLNFTSCWFEANGNTGATIRLVLNNSTDTSALFDNCTFANNSDAAASSPYHISVVSDNPYKIMVRGGQWTTDNLTKTLNDTSGNGIVSVAGVLAANWTSSSAATRIGYTLQGANADVGSFGELTVVSPIKSGYPRMVNTAFGATTIGFTGTQWLPSNDNAVDLGAAAARFAVVRAGTGTISTSDAREKEQQRGLSEVERDIAVTLKGMLKAFKWKASVAEKGDKSRWHFGIMAQEMGDTFRAAGLDPHEYGMFCYDEWGDIHDPENGELSIGAGNRYGVRYDQLLAFIIAAL